MTKASASDGRGKARVHRLSDRFGVAAAFMSLATVLCGPFTTELPYTKSSPVWVQIVPPVAFFLGLMLKEIVVGGVVVVRRLHNWASPLLTLTGALLLAIPAVLFPPRARRAWLGEVLESLTLRREHRTNWFMVLASYVRTWPADLQDEWLDYLSSRPNDLDLNQAVATPAEKTGGFWKRHRVEIGVGLVFAVVFAIPGAVAYEAVTEWMHHNGYRWAYEPAASP